MNASLSNTLTPGLIVSCQAPPQSPLRDPHVIAAMALAAERAGAVAVRVNGSQHIEAVRAVSSLPIIGLIKRKLVRRGQIITPHVEDALQAIESGAEIVAFDARKDRHDVDEILELTNAIHSHGAFAMADVADLADGVDAHRLGADIIASTLAPPSHDNQGPDFELIAALRDTLPSAVIVAEGRISSPDELAHAFARGADSVVVGTAITDALELSRRFVAAVPGEKR